MKRILFLLFISLSIVLVGCGNNAEVSIEDERLEEKKSEMAEITALNYLENISKRYLQAEDYENGSFEQKSELQAGIKAVDSAIQEIEEEYEEDLPIANDVIELANEIRQAMDERLNGNYDLYDFNYLIGEKTAEIVYEYLDGRFPPTMKYRLQMEESLNN